MTILREAKPPKNKCKILKMLPLVGGKDSS